MALTRRYLELVNSQRIWNAANHGELGAVVSGSAHRVLMGNGCFGLDVIQSGEIFFITSYDTQEAVHAAKYSSNGCMIFLLCLRQYPGVNEEYPIVRMSLAGLQADYSQMTVDHTGRVRVWSGAGQGNFAAESLALNTLYFCVLKNTVSNYGALTSTADLYVATTLTTTGTPLIRITTGATYLSNVKTAIRCEGSGERFWIGAIGLYESPHPDTTAVEDYVTKWKTDTGITTMPTQPLAVYFRDDALVTGVGGTGAANNAVEALSFTDFLYTGAAYAEPATPFKTWGGTSIVSSGSTAAELEAIVIANGITSSASLNRFVVATNIVATNQTIPANTVLVGWVEGLTGNEIIQLDVPSLVNCGAYSESGGHTVFSANSLATQSVLFEDGNWMGKPNATASITDPCVMNGTAAATVLAALLANPGSFWNNGTTMFFQPSSGDTTSHVYTQTRGAFPYFAGFMGSLTLRGSTLMNASASVVNGNALLWFSNKTWSIAKNLTLTLPGSYHNLEEIPTQSNARYTNLNITMGPDFPDEWGMAEGGSVTASQRPIAAVVYKDAVTQDPQASFRNVNYTANSGIIGTQTGRVTASGQAFISHSTTNSLYQITSLIFTDVDFSGGTVVFGTNGTNGQAVAAVVASGFKSLNLTGISGSFAGGTETLTFTLAAGAVAVKIATDGGAYGDAQTSPATVTGLNAGVSHTFALNAVNSHGLIVGQGTAGWTVNGSRFPWLSFQPVLGRF